MFRVSALLVASCVASSLAMFPMFHKMPKCEEPFGEWETADKCIWPGLSTYDDIPKACRGLPPRPAKMPELPYKLLQAKGKEFFNAWIEDFTKRGVSKELCGMCGFKARCRGLKNPPKTMHCPVKQKVIIYDDECQKPEPCKIKKGDGMCEAPESMAMLHMMTAMKAMSQPGGMSEEMKYGWKIEMFMGMMLGMGGMGMGMGMDMMGMGMMGKGKGMGGKMGHGGKMGAGGKMDDGNLASKITELAEAFKGKSKEDIISTFKTMMAKDGDVAKKIQEAMQIFAGLFQRNKRQAEQGKIDLKDNESFITPKMNCVENSKGDGCVCCCNWYIPDRDNNKCVDIKDDMIAFMKDFKKDMEM